MSVSLLFPDRNALRRIECRGKIGVEGKVSTMNSLRVGKRMLLRGRNGDGVIWGYPYRDSNGKLKGRTIERSAGCQLEVFAPPTITLTLTGWRGYISAPQYEVLEPYNGTRVLTGSFTPTSGQWRAPVSTFASIRFVTGCNLPDVWTVQLFDAFDLLISWRMFAHDPRDGGDVVEYQNDRGVVVTQVGTFTVA